ncbi:hypothetical protein FC697_22260 [Bacillus wiedmannii]|uniref:S-Ena type endospore appendage n=1 Tax=Bacillus wiedmannii TaxID=1890302 RepID=UPI0010BD6FE7|nr:S-Ena type endospore appendage [Bacillus wiedmannii]TKH17362.1 hypothetical protein FC697_22260 [Bacillus wiedmannii]
MSNSEFCLNNCCPESEFILEKICGDVNNDSTTSITLPVWTTTDTSYISGTFEVFNPISSVGTVIINLPGNFAEVHPGVSEIRTSIRPDQFVLTVAPNTSGTYCITLYKRISA